MDGGKNEDHNTNSRHIHTVKHSQHHPYKIIFDIEFGVTDYWEVHGVFFLIFIRYFQG